MKTPTQLQLFRRCKSSSREGAALVIVLAFIVILTGLVVAFFSRALLDQQISTSSSNRSKVELLAGGAVDSIIGDLKQEITAGSTVTTFGTNSLYIPTANTTMVPALALPSGATATNLLKISYYGKTFFPTGGPYTSSFTPNRAAGPNNSTTSASLNGRSISLARWNKALLLPKASATSTDPTPNSTFVPPDWILVSRAGLNPGSTTSASFGASSSAVNNPVLSNTNYVVGRYAYAVYDEGGLLDMNVAGYSATPTNAQSNYKNSLASVDLTQVGLTTAQINAIVNWRNYASVSTTSPLSGTFPSYGSWTVANSTNYFNSALGNRTGFLKTSNPTVVNSQTDRMFSSRQQLIDCLLATDPAHPANLQNSLQYLTHFSRGLDRPSFVPATGLPSINTTATGGNDAGGSALSTFNPSFLSQTVTVSTAFTRNDSTQAVVGEPLVKKRFALNRLAWVTYLGPISDGSGASGSTTVNSNPSIQAIAKLYHDTYGLSYSFLQQGTATNIKNYFGLQWQVDSSTSIGIGDGTSKWFYNVHLWGLTGTGSTGPIMVLGDSTGIAGLSSSSKMHEPDFFELLKATVSTGSLGKAYSYTASPSPLAPAGYQQQRDNSIDAQIMQMGANIIDQFDLDGYPTRIIFNDGLLFGGKPQEYRGIEDLPYIYRVREGKITVRDSAPTQANLPSTAVTTPTDAGLCAVMQEPEIWNPHAWSTSNPDTNARPTKFRFVAISADPNNPSSAAKPVSVSVQCFTAGGTNKALPSNQILSSPGAPWTETNTELDFSIPANKLSLFREPTLLIKPGIPTGSNLAIGSNAQHLITKATSTNYVTSFWPSTQIKSNGGTDNKHYIGILAYYGPVAWPALIPKGEIDGTNPTSTTSGVVEAALTYLPSAINITYRMQYQDGLKQWVTYDEKYMPYVYAESYNNGSYSSPSNKTFNSNNGSPPTQDNIIGTELGQVCFDPRTSRFGMSLVGPNGYRGSGSSQFPIRQNVPSIGWAAATRSGAAFIGAINQLALASMRPDNNAGFSFGGDPAPGNGYSFLQTGPTALGWYPNSTTPTKIIIQPGMFAQNNPAEVSKPSNMRQVSSDGQLVGGTLNQYFADADGVVRRAMSGYVPTDSTNPATPPSSGPSGLPLKVATDYSSPIAPVPNAENSSRPIVLNRPFRSVGELGYVFSGTPWRNLSVSTPESSSATVMDVFCVNDTDNTNGLVAGKVNLNTRQAPVLNAILAGAYRDELYPGTTSVVSPLTSTDAATISTALISRTTSTAASSVLGQGPLMNVSELAGKWNSSVAIGSSINGSKSYVGFSNDLRNNTSGKLQPVDQCVERFGEASIRALAAVGQTRVWNVMIDVVAQTGRYPSSANSLSQFNVEGEQRYWVHLAIDRFTGQILDKQVEIVKE